MDNYTNKLNINEQIKSPSDEKKTESQNIGAPKKTSGDLSPGTKDNKTLNCLDNFISIKPNTMTCKPVTKGPQLSDLVGNYGAYQAFCTIVLFMRYLLLGLMSNSGPLLAPDVDFYCELQMSDMIKLMPNISQMSVVDREREIKEELHQVCQLDLYQYAPFSNSFMNSNTTDSISNSNPYRNRYPYSSDNSTMMSMLMTMDGNLPKIRYRECNKFTYEPSQPDEAKTLTTEFDLVCDREALRSVFQSSISASIVIAHVFWGTFSDRYGRYTAQRLCLILCLISGAWSIFASDFWTITIARVINSFGDLGLVVSLTTNVVELVGSKYRGVTVSCVNFGSALGVALLPYIVAHYGHFRMVLMFSFLCNLATAPFILFTNESVRWLMTNDKHESAIRELQRILTWNRRHMNVLDYLIFKKHKISGQDMKADLKEKSEKFIREDSSGTCCNTVESQKAMELPLNTLNMTITANSIVCDSKKSSFSDTQLDKIQSPLDLDSLTEINIAPTLMLPSTTTTTTTTITYEQYDTISDSNQDMCITKIDMNGSVQVDKQQNHIVNFSETCDQADLILAKRYEQLKRHSLARGLNIQDPSGAVNGMINSMARHRTDCVCMVASQLSFVGRINRLFRDKRLMIAVLTIVWTTFNSELLYMSFIMINLEAGENKYLNYLLGACMEGLAALVSSALLMFAPRRQSLIIFWLLISITCFGLSIAHIDSHWAVWLLAMAKFHQSSLSSIAMVAAYEAFPTSLRQSGSGLVFTLGMLGSVFAPLIITELDDQDRLDTVLMIFSLLSLSAGLLVYCYLKETKDRELQ